VAGVDLGSSEHWVCVDPDLDAEPVRRFGALTEDLRTLVGWLQSLGITSVAMESTGPYWFQLYRELVAVDIEVVLVDPRQTRNPRNRKTDMLDCQNIWQLHAHGLLSAAFVPSAVVQRLRTYVRFRQSREVRLRQAQTAMHDALARMNVKLGSVISDIGGVTGRKIITAILGGERDPMALAGLRDRRCRRDAATIAKALEGTWHAEDLFLLEQANADYETQQNAIADADEQIDALLTTIVPPDAPEPVLALKRTPHKTGFAFDAQRAVARLVGVDLAAIDGIAPYTAFNFIAEIGFSVDPWPTAAAFCAWMDLCPNPKRSGGRTKGTMPTTANRAANILLSAAHGLTNKPGVMGKRFAKMAARKGRSYAIKDAAHRYARIIYAMMKTGKPYDSTMLEPRTTPRQKARVLKHLQARAVALGMALVPIDNGSKDNALCKC
jgi:transposase